MTVAELVKEFIAALLSRCPKCWEPLACIRDWRGGFEGYGLYYCPRCDKQDVIKLNSYDNRNKIQHRG